MSSKMNQGVVYLSEQEVIDIAVVKEQVETLFAVVGELKSDVKEIKEQLANRLPLWATTLIGMLTGIIGYLAGH